MSTGTAGAQAAQTAQVAEAGSPGAGGSPAAVAIVGDVNSGQTQFLLLCQRCHQPAGNGLAKALKGPDNPATAYTDQQLFDLIRTGTGHAKPPGAFTVVQIPNNKVNDIIAFIRDQSK